MFLALFSLAGLFAAPKNIYAAPEFSYALTAANDPVSPGQVAKFTVTVTNLTAVSKSTVLTLHVPGYTTYQPYSNTYGAGTAYSLGTWTVGAGGTASTDIDLKVLSGTAAPPDGTPIDLTVEDQARAASVARSVVARTSPVADLELATDQGTVAPGGVFGYTLVYHNSSGGTLTGTQLTLPLPVGAGFVSATGGGTLGSGTVHWSLTPLAAGATGQVQVSLTAPPASTANPALLIAAALRDASNIALAQASTTKAIYAAPEFSYALTAANDPVSPGQVAKFTVTVTNLTAVSKSTVLTLHVPGYTTYQPYSNTYGAGTAYSLGTWTVGAGGTASTDIDLKVLSGTAAPPDGTPIDLTVEDQARAASVARAIAVRNLGAGTNGGPLAFAKLTPGIVSSAGQVNQWTFSGNADDILSVLVNPGPNGSPAAASPQLQWANVQLLDANNKVLATAADVNAGDPLSLSEIVLPASGAYKVNVGATTGHSSATGNYVISARLLTPVSRSLTLGQQTQGNISSLTSLDRWTFSAAVGQQVQLHVLSSSSGAVGFKLAGPLGYVAFKDLITDSALISIPAFGTYTLSAYSLTGGTGSYSFVVQPTNLTALSSGVAYNGSWSGTGQARLFTLPVAMSGPLSVALADATAADHTEIYARFGAPPTRELYDYADNGSGSSHSLFVSPATAGTWYFLIYGESIKAPPGGYTILATLKEIILTKSSASMGTSNTNTTLVLTGAGFNGGTKVSLVASNGTVIAAATSTVNLPTQITATFPVGTLAAGSYTIQVTQADGSTAQLPMPFTVAANGQGVLSAHLEVPNPIGRHIATVLYVNYSNAGNAAMPAPLLTVGATNPLGLQGAFMTLDSSLQTSGFWTSATPAGYLQSVQILASGATPGVLQPGESMRVPIYYAGWLTTQWDFNHPTLNFSLTTLRADDTTAVDWPSKETSLQPTGISNAAWHIMYAGLLPMLGTTAGGYVKLLDDNAAYLGSLGKNVTDISKLWSFAIAQTENVWPLPSLGGVTDDSLPTPGALPLSFSRAFNNTIPGRFQSGPLGLGWFTPWQQGLTIGTDGTVTLTNASGARYIYQPDSRHAGFYFSQPGDTSTLTATGSGYMLTAPNGTISAFDTTGKLVYLQDTHANKIITGYGGGRLATLTASSGQLITLAYNGAGLISTLTDSASRVTTYTYDAGNQHLKSVRAWNGQTTSYDYNTTAGSIAQNALTSIAFPDGTHQYLTYDASGRLATIAADGSALAKTFTYTNGQVSTTDALGDTSSLFFNENGQIARTGDALGNPTYYSYDSSFNLAKVTNATGASASYAHNSVGEVTSATDFLGNSTGFAYDGAHYQLSKLTDANGNVTRYTYSTSGDLLSTIYADNSSTSSSYDPLGNALSFVNAAGQPIQYARNTAGQFTKATFADGSSYTYAYDSHGRMTSATDANGAVIFPYDATTGFLTKVAYPNGLHLTFTYDAGGRRSSMADQTGFTTNYAYDTVGRLSALKDGSGNTIVTYLYDAAGRLSKKTNGNGTYTTYDYDGNGHVLHLINYAPGGTINSRFDDTYNALELKTAEATLDGLWTYTCDANGQLTHAVFTSNNAASVPNQDLAYNYDAMGNRTSTVINGVTTAYVVNNMNQYVSVGGTAYSYDAKSNLLSDGTNAYSYDSLNRLIGYTQSSGTTMYAYNALQQKVATRADGLTTQSLIDPAGLGSVVGTYDDTENVIERIFQGLSPAEKLRGDVAYFYDYDVAGNTVGDTSDSGNYLSRFIYAPFGEKLLSVGATLGTFGFAGQSEVQSEARNLNLVHSRHYLPSLGRFASLDPAGVEGGDLNPYRYDLNNPVQLLDPSGFGLAGQLYEEYGYFTDIREVEQGKVGKVAGEHIGEKLGEEAGSLLGSAYGTRYGASTLVAVAVKLHLNPVGIVIAGVVGKVWGKEIFGFVGKEIGGGLGKEIGAHEGEELQSYVHDRYFPFLGDEFPPMPTPFQSLGDTTTNTVGAQDPNGLYGPAGYGAANFVTNLGDTFAYRITYENDAAATAPAQSVVITNNLDAHLDWSTFQLTGIGFGDNNLVIPPGSQHYQTTLSMTYNGQTFDVQMETGLHSDTGQVYATFQSIDPNTSLPPANVLTGFLPPEDGTGRGQGYLTYTVSPKASLATGTVISNVASIVFDAGVAITTDQVDPHDPTKGTDPKKRASVTIDSVAPTSHVAALPAMSPDYFWVRWSGTDDASGIVSYSIYVSENGGASWSVWLSNTTATAAIYPGQAGKTYAFYSIARDGAGNGESKSVADASTQTTTGGNFQGNVVVAKGDPAPGVANGKFSLADSPAVDAMGDVVFKAFIVGTNKTAGIGASNNAGIWSYTGTAGSLLVQTGVTQAPRTADATFASVSDPAMDAEGSIAFTGGLKGGDVTKNPNNSTGVWLRKNGATGLIVRQSGAAADQPNAIYKQFAQIVTQDADDAAFLATLAGEKVKASANLGLWGADLHGTLHSVIHTGQALAIDSDQRTVTAIKVFPTTTKEKGQSRSVDALNGRLTFGLSFADKASAIFVGTPAASGFDLESAAATWDASVPGVANAKYAAFGNPAVNKNGTIAFRATLASTSKATKITAANGTGIWLDTGTATSLVARKGDLAADGGGAVFATIEEPVLNNNDKVAFIGALLKAKNLVTAATAAGIWSNTSGSLHLVARQGNSAAGVTGGKFSEFDQVVLPDTGGPIFLAKLTGVKANVNTGVWCISADGQTHLIGRTGDTLDVHGTSKVIKSLSIFTVCPQVAGQSRNFDAATRGMVLSVTFSDGTWAIVQAIAP